MPRTVPQQLMHAGKLMRGAVLLLPCFLALGAASASPVPAALAPGTVVVEVSGSVPGFTTAQLGSYLAHQMRDATGGTWQFSARQPDEPPAPNRISWSFKTLRIVWRGGSHKGFPSPTNTAAYLSVEVKLYLNDTYQTTALAQPTIAEGGPDDKALSETVRSVARILFIESKPPSK